MWVNTAKGLLDSRNQLPPYIFILSAFFPLKKRNKTTPPQKQGQHPLGKEQPVCCTCTAFNLHENHLSGALSRSKILDSLFPAAHFPKTLLTASSTFPSWPPHQHHSCCPCHVADGCIHCTVLRRTCRSVFLASWSGCCLGVYKGSMAWSMSSSSCNREASCMMRCVPVWSDVMRHLLALTQCSAMWSVLFQKGSH